VTNVLRPDGLSESKSYDSMNRVQSATIPIRSGLNQTTNFSYWPSGMLKEVNDAYGRITRFNYDAADRKKQMVYPDDPNRDNPATDYEQWNYDAAYNLFARRTVNGTTQNFTFDNRNRKTGMSWSNGADSATYKYDAASRLTDANNPSATVHRVYDSAGRLTNDTQTPVGLAAKDLQYTYDNANRLIRTMMPGTGDNYTRSYDARGRLATVGDSNGGAWIGYGYDAASNVTSRNTLLTGSYELFPRDALNRITSRGLVQNGAAVSTETYTYDDASHVSRLTGVARSEDGKSDKFGYDYASELVSAQYGLVSGTNPNRTVGYTLDLVGNRNIVTDGGFNSNYAPNALNQYTGSVGPAAITNGNEHEIASYLGVAYQYINDGQLKQATSGANVYGIKYDALGRVVSRTLNNATTYYINDGEQAFNEWSATGSWLATNIYGAGVDEIVMRFTPTIVYTFYQDHEGSITHVYGGLTLAETYRYDAFGQPTIKNWAGNLLTTSAINNRFMFTGREWAPVNLGFYEYRARAYHPGLGRFMSEDPKGFDAGDYNLFRYCGNDPEDRTDPMGLTDAERNGDAEKRAAMRVQTHEIRQEFTGSRIPQVVGTEITVTMARFGESGSKSISTKTSGSNSSSGSTIREANRIAKGVLQRINPQSIRQNLEKIFLVYKDGDSRQVVASGVQTTTETGLEAKFFISKGSEVYGIGHTHGDYSRKDPTTGNIARTTKALDGFHSDTFSDTDKYNLQGYARQYPTLQRGYLGTPSGALLQYDLRRGVTTPLD